MDLKPAISIKKYTHDGRYLITQSRAIGAVKSFLIELAPTYYPNGNRAYPHIFAHGLSLENQVEAVAGWCERIKGDNSVLSRRADSVYKKCVELLAMQQKRGFNITRRSA